MAQWWEHTPPANVTRFRFPDPACGLSFVGSLLCTERFSPGTPAGFPSPQKPTFDFICVVIFSLQRSQLVLQRLERLNTQIKFLYYCRVFSVNALSRALRTKKILQKWGKWFYVPVHCIRKTKMNWRLQIKVEAKGKQNLAELLFSVQSRLLWHFGCENRFLFFFCFKVSKCFSSVGLFVLYIFYISCLFFLLLNQVCRFNKKCCRVIHSLQQRDEITPIDPTRTSGIGCFLTTLLYCSHHNSYHTYFFSFFLNSQHYGKIVRGTGF